MPDQLAEISSIASRYQAFVFDLDGTILLGETLLPTAARTISKLRSDGRTVLFLTNNTTASATEYACKLTHLGLPVEAEDVVTAAHVLIELLRRDMPHARLMVLGESALVRELELEGFVVTDEISEIDYVIASFDRTFSYDKLKRAFRAVRAGARLIATNADRFRPTAEGGEPDAAAIIAAIEASSGSTCEAIVGKPSEAMTRYLLERLKADPGRCLLIGDRLDTDILMANNAGIASALVLTGATSIAEAESSTITATYILRSLAEILHVHD
ncbi:MAG: HAD-IIA family hydrolase [Comamonadaceae bacterium]|nr:MAG: HAD-IIA family hydrolase [Comamonadaceae bacterium]